MSVLAACFAYTLSEEGGFSDDPDDPGGATEKGVTLATYRAWVDDQTATVAMLRNITDATAAAIFRVRYFNPVQGDLLPPGVCLSTVDMAFNAGPAQSARILQRCVGATPDGAVGPLTLLAVRGVDPGTLIAALAVRQADFYRSLMTFRLFGKGWLLRCARREIAAHALQHGNTAPVAPPPVVASTA